MADMATAAIEVGIAAEATYQDMSFHLIEVGSLAMVTVVDAAWTRGAW